MGVKRGPTTVVVFFPVTLLYGMSKFLFSALALAVVISLFASYFVALTVVPLFCAPFISGPHAVDLKRPSLGRRFVSGFNQGFAALLARYHRAVARVLLRSRAALAYSGIGFALLLFPLLGLSFFPRTDAGQFVISFKAPSGTKIQDTTAEAARLEDLVRRTVPKRDLDIMVVNIGVDPGFSALFTPNSAMHTGFLQVGLRPDHRLGSFLEIADEMPELETFFSSGSLVDGVLNMGAPAPVDVRFEGTNLAVDYSYAQRIAARIRSVRGVADVFIPQDVDYPSLRLNVDRTRARELGLSENEIVSNVITALTSNVMIAPSVWIDPRSGNNYFLTVQYKDGQVNTLEDLKAIPLHGEHTTAPTRLDMVASIQPLHAPTEVDHRQIRREVDTYVRPAGEDLGRVSQSIRGGRAGSRRR